MDKLNYKKLMISQNIDKYSNRKKVVSRLTIFLVFDNNFNDMIIHNMII